MELLAYLGLFIFALSVLLVASDWFIDSAEAVGLSFGISPYIIGVTIIAFGTSLPELATSIAAIYSGESQVVVGNVIGSNVTNILLILGAVAFMTRGGIRMHGQMLNTSTFPGFKVYWQDRRDWYSSSFQNQVENVLYPNAEPFVIGGSKGAN